MKEISATDLRNNLRALLALVQCDQRLRVAAWIKVIPRFNHRDSRMAKQAFFSADRHIQAVSWMRPSGDYCLWDTACIMPGLARRQIHAVVLYLSHSQQSQP